MRQLPRLFPTSVPPQAQYQRETTPQNRDVVASLVLGQLVAEVERTDVQRARSISCPSSHNVESVHSAEALSVTPQAWERERRPLANLSVFPRPRWATEDTFRRAPDNLRPQSSMDRVLRRNDDSATDRAIEGFENVEALHEESSSSGEETFPEVFGPRNNPGDPDILSTRPTPLPLTSRPARRKDEITSAPPSRTNISRLYSPPEDSSSKEEGLFEFPGLRTGVPQIRTPTTHDSMSLPERPLGDTLLPRPAAETPRSHTYVPDILCPQPIRTWQIADEYVADVDRAQTQSNVLKRRGSLLRGDPAIERIRARGRVSPLNVVSQDVDPSRTQTQSKSKDKSDAGTWNISPVSSSSPSPTAVAYPRSPYMFRSPLSRYSSSANNNPQPMMPPQSMVPPPLPPLQGPRGPGPQPPLPLYNIEDQFNAISIQNTQQPRPHPGSAAPHMPYPRFSPGGPSPGYRGYYDAVPPMLLRDPVLRGPDWGEVENTPSSDLSLPPRGPDWREVENPPSCPSLDLHPVPLPARTSPTDVSTPCSPELSSGHTVSQFRSPSGGPVTHREDLVAPSENNLLSSSVLNVAVEAANVVDSAQHAVIPDLNRPPSYPDLPFGSWTVLSDIPDAMPSPPSVTVPLSSNLISPSLLPDLPFKSWSILTDISSGPPRPASLKIPLTANPPTTLGSAARRMKVPLFRQITSQSNSGGQTINENKVAE